MEGQPDRTNEFRNRAAVRFETFVGASKSRRLIKDKKFETQRNRGQPGQSSCCPCVSGPVWEDPTFPQPPFRESADTDTSLKRQGRLQDGGRIPSILVVEYWNLGDFVMITPFLKNLRLHFPRAHIVLLASPRTIPLAEGQAFIDEVIPVTVPWVPHMSRWKKYFSRDWIGLFQCVRMLRKRRFDLGFTARADVRENFIMWAGGIKRRVGYGFAYGGRLLTGYCAARSFPVALFGTVAALARTLEQTDIGPPTGTKTWD